MHIEQGLNAAGQGMSRQETETWGTHLVAYQSSDPALFSEDFLDKHRNEAWKPSEADKKAADLLHIQITSRAVSQPLLDLDGYENVALTSLYQIFSFAREAGEKHFGATHFNPLAWHVINSFFRPFMAKWHKLSQDKGLPTSELREEFRTEFTTVQRVLLRLDELLLDIRDGRVRPRAASSSSGDLVSPTERTVGERTSIDALIMKGGGVKGLAFAGAIRELERFFDFGVFVGTSAGAVAAALLAAGATGAQLEDKLRRKPFREFLDGNLWITPFTFWTLRGLHPGYSFVNWLRGELHACVSKYGDILMEDLPKRAVVYASTRDAGEIAFDSIGEHKDTAVHTAVRCSMSIPYFFQPQWFDNRRVYDGGLLHNYPVQVFLDQERQKSADSPQPNFIALYLGSTKPRPLNPGSVFADLLSISIDRNDAKIIDRYRPRTILIETDPIGTIDFDLTEDEKNYLVHQGQVAALAFLADRGKLDPSDMASLDQLRAETEMLRANVNGVRQKARVRFRRRLLTVAAVGLMCASSLALFPLRLQKIQGASSPCQLAASLEVPVLGADIRPLFLALSAGGQMTRDPIGLQKSVDLTILPEHVSRYSLTLEWSDNTRSNFGYLSGCRSENRKSDDGRSTLHLTVRQ